MQERASGGARLDGLQNPHGKEQNSADAYKACSLARVQGEMKNPPPPADTEPGGADNPQGDTLEEVVRGLFIQDTAEEG